MNADAEYVHNLERLLNLVSDAIEAGRIDAPEMPEDHNDRQALIDQIARCQASRPKLAAPEGLTVEQMALISTAHVPESEANSISAGLEDGSGSSIGMVRDEGFLVHTGGDEDECADAYPQLAALRRHFAAMGYPWILFDRDADRVPGLAEFDW